MLLFFIREYNTEYNITNIVIILTNQIADILYLSDK